MDQNPAEAHVELQGVNYYTLLEEPSNGAAGAPCILLCHVSQIIPRIQRRDPLPDLSPTSHGTPAVGGRMLTASLTLGVDVQPAHVGCHSKRPQ